MNGPLLMDLEERPQTARASSSEPLLPRRDSTEDADSSLTRKRPRLGSCDRATRSMSADHESSSSHTLAPDTASETGTDDVSHLPDSNSNQPPPVTAQSSMVTINVRPHPRPSDADVSSTLLPNLGGEKSNEALSPSKMPLNDQDENEVTKSDAPKKDSPHSPVVEIEIDDPEDMDLVQPMIQIEDEERTSEDYVAAFPYAQSTGAYASAAEAIASHLQQAPIDPNVFDNLSQWLSKLPERLIELKTLCIDFPDLFGHIATIMQRLLQRRTHFGSEFRNWLHESEEGAVYKLLDAYVKLVPQLVLIDIETMENFNKEVTRQSNQIHLWSVKHWKILNVIFRCSSETPLWQLLSSEYEVDCATLCKTLTHTFIDTPVDGAHIVCKFLVFGLGKAPATQVIQSLRLLDALGSSLRYDCSPNVPGDIQTYRHAVLELFQVVDQELHDSSKDIDVSLSKDLILQGSKFLAMLASNDPGTALQLAEKILGTDTSSHDSEDLPALIANAWKFDLLIRYVMKAKMELRVACIITMDSELVEVWKEYCGTAAGIQHPLMQYLAGLLLEKRIVQYITSAESHPQLITRSGNIVGFLAVTNRYREKETDTIWHAITTGQDRNQVSAIIAMFKGILNLIDIKDLMYICEKLSELPVNLYTPEMLLFLREVCFRTQGKVSEWSEIDTKSNPCQICIKLIQETSPCSTPGTLTDVYQEASELLKQLSQTVGYQERMRIYKACIEDISPKNPKATGSIQAIVLLARSSGPNDSNPLTSELQLANHLVPELCSFFDTYKSTPIDLIPIKAMETRLDLLSYVMRYNPDSVSSDYYDPLWSHLVGADAVGDGMRDRAWRRLSEMAQSHLQTDNPLLKYWVEVSLPSLQPEYFTNGLYEFVLQSTQHVMLTADSILADDGDTINIPGAEMLWHLILNAQPNNSHAIERNAAMLLATRYLDVLRIRGISLVNVEAAHVALVKQCLGQLPDASSRMELDQNPVNEDDPTIEELRGTRTITVLSLVLQYIRARPEFNPPARRLSKTPPSDQGIIRGDPVKIRYQAYDGNSSDIKEVTVGSLETFDELYARLAQLTGFAEFMVIAAGQKIDFRGCGDQKICESKQNISWLLIRKLPGSGQVQRLPKSDANCSAFEKEILDHIDSLYALMNGEDHLSEEIYKFLRMFPPDERLTQAVAAGSSTADELFHPGQSYRSRYAIAALKGRLTHQLNKGIMDDSFIFNAIRLLVQAVLNKDLINVHLSSRHDKQLVEMLADTLVAFLKERPLNPLPENTFSYEADYVDRLVSFILNAPKIEGFARLVRDCYAILIESSLHSQAVWAVFKQREDMETIHRLLLLEDERPNLRAAIARVIDAIGSDFVYSSPSPMNPGEIPAFYWNAFSTLIPESPRYRIQAREFYETSERVFRRNNEFHRDEATLRSYLTSWGEILLDYQHVECVGRDEIDIVILGFSKLLLCCIQNLKSFKKPLNAHPLMEKIFSKFLFIPQSESGTFSQSSEPDYLPVLESSTRQQLYEVVLGLCEDITGYAKLLELSTGAIREATKSQRYSRDFFVERVNELRSQTGYLGLNNPRQICYMNSLLTQLFMNIEFRKFMLAAPVTDAHDSQKLLDGTQRLFATMQNSFIKAANSEDLAICVKGPNGRPIDIAIQMDVDEFSNCIFDQWESQMLSPEAKQQFRSFYGGNLITQIKSKECEHVSERTESFFAIPCDVKGKATLQDSLQSFVHGEVMEGDNKYKCESCGGLFVDAVKRTCLKDVPDNLIFHLKRFDYDLNIDLRYKIDDLFEFPDHIDLGPYNVQHLQDPSVPSAEDLFELVGVLVHTGSSEAGHYYSYIRERPSSSKESSTWFEFNDSEVSHLDPSQISQGGFGGWAGYEDSHFHPGPKQKPYNAYMLFYQRKSAIQSLQESFPGSQQLTPQKVPIPIELESEIFTSNCELVRSYCLFDQNHSIFIRKMFNQLRTLNNGTCSESHMLEKVTIGLLLEHYHEFIVHTKDLTDLEPTLAMLKRTISGCSSCCEIVLQWLSQHETALLTLLIRCPHAKVRMYTRQFLLEALFFLREKDSFKYGLDRTEQDLSTPLYINEEGCLPALLERMLSMSHNLHLNTRSWDDFHMTLCSLARWGAHEAFSIIDKGFFTRCLEIISLKSDSRLREINAPIWRAMEKKRIGFNKLIELLYLLLSYISPHSVVAEETARVPLTDTAKPMLPLLLIEKRYLENWLRAEDSYVILGRIFEMYDYGKAEQENTDQIPTEIVKFYLRGDGSFCELDGVTSTMTYGIQELAAPFAEPYVLAAGGFCEECPTEMEALKVITAVATSASQLGNQAGYAHLRFFSALTVIRNENIFHIRGDDWFYVQVINTAHIWGPALLVYDDDDVRVKTRNILEFLLMTNWTGSSSPVNLNHRYNAHRRLIQQCSRRVLKEYNDQVPRNYVEAALQILQQSVNVLMSLHENPSMEEFRHPDDANLVHKFKLDIEPLIPRWQLEEDFLASGGEGYDASDYQTDSDDIIEN